jgi:hypothetical protein
MHREILLKVNGTNCEYDNFFGSDCPPKRGGRK